MMTPDPVPADGMMLNITLSAETEVIFTTARLHCLYMRILSASSSVTTTGWVLANAALAGALALWVAVQPGSAVTAAIIISAAVRSVLFIIAALPFSVRSLVQFLPAFA